MCATAVESHSNALIEMVRSFAERELAPHAARWDREAVFPVDTFREMGRLGLLGIPLPEQYGGGGGSVQDYILAVEEIAKADAGVGCAYSVHVSAVAMTIAAFGSEEQKARYLPKMATGEWIGAYALTEPGHGSDAGHLQAKAVRDGDGWVLSGTKQWITNAGYAQAFLVFARTNADEPGPKGITCFIVEAGTPGLEVGRVTHKMGVRSSDTRDLVLNQVRVTDAQILGSLGGGFTIAMRALDSGRIGIAAQAVGIATAALEAAKRFALERESFGQSIAKFQAIQWKFADGATRLQAARLLVQKAAQLRNDGRPHTLAGSMAKLYASKTCREICNEAVQIHGGYGYTDEFPVERHYRDAKITEIYEGTSEIQKLVIWRNIQSMTDHFEKLADSYLNEEQRMARDMMAELAYGQFAGRAMEIDHTEEIPWDNIQAMRDAGVLGLPIEEAYGGGGSDYVSFAIMSEVFAETCATTSVIMDAHISLAMKPIALFGTEAQKQAWLPRMATGEWLGCFALTEPNSGSDAGSLRTTAVRDGDDYILNGGKVFITNGSFSKVAIVFASTDLSKGNKGISAFIVDTASPGFVVGKKEEKMGIRASDTRALFFENLRVPAANRLGEEGQGFKVALATLDGGRIGIGAQAIGIAHGAFIKALKYTQEREQFKQKIADFQGVQFMLAEMATEIEAARLLVRYGAELKDAGEKFNMVASMGKLLASEVASWAANRAVQLHGGYGFVREYEVERYMRDAKITELYEGTSEIQRLVIGSNYLGVR
ncbi:MAG: acyl-CoA dehydrogenase family protein [Candidatus Sericytochromatia bacterium]|nr:acyl-CoA dehydrogenase family protein [Candidatus Sericytochromatia bacterium]